MSSTPPRPLHLDVTLSRDDVNAQITRLLLPHLAPEWHENDLQFLDFEAGQTNHLVGVRAKDPDHVLLVRIFGTSSHRFIDRKFEQKLIRTLHKHRMAEPLLIVFTNGYVYPYVPGRALTKPEARQPEMARLIALEFARLHSVPVPDDLKTNGRKSYYFTTFEKMITMLPDKIDENQEMDQRYQSDILYFDFRGELEEYQRFMDFDEEFVICHHDAMPSNFIVLPDGSRTRIIDYEYGGLDYASMDIATHVKYYSSSREPRPRAYITQDALRQFLKIYLTERFGQETVNEDVLKLWQKRVNKMTLFASMWWSLWCICQEFYSEKKAEFPFFEWTIRGLKEYERFKPHGMMVP